MKTTSTIPDLVTVYRFVELLEILPVSRGSEAVRRRLDGAATGGGSSALTSGSSGRTGGSSGLVGSARLAQDLLCRKVEVSIFRARPKKVLLFRAEKFSVISGRKNPAHDHPTGRIGP
jgi:hypothetical protein